MWKVCGKTQRKHKKYIKTMENKCLENVDKCGNENDMHKKIGEVMGNMQKTPQTIDNMHKKTYNYT